MKTTFKEPGFHRCAFKVNIPSYLGEWCFLMATGKNWAGNMIDLKLPAGLKHFNRTEFLEKTRWTDEYPTELVNYWKTESSWASVAAKAKEGTKNLTVHLDHSEKTDLSDYYGC
jgi:hypothetical protein